jgi:hypothetical protein
VPARKRQRKSEK